MNTPIPMDDSTLDRLFSGTLDPDDAPPGFSGVAAVLRAAAATVAVSTPQLARANQQLTLTAHEQQQIASMIQAMSSGDAPTPAPRPRRLVPARAKLGGLVVAGMVLGSTGLAMAGALPSPAQNFAATVLSKVGISVPHHGSQPSNNQSGTVVPVATPSNGPDPNGPSKFGLCNAYARGQGGTNGGKNDSVAFQNLAEAAGGASNIADFCKGATPGGKPAGQHGKAKGHTKTHTNSGHGGQNPPATPPGRGRHGGQ